MKEKIYTIPINEAYEQDCECPFCFLTKRLEEEAVDYSLGAAMMEPDFRILSNEKGFCNMHYSMMLKKPNKLSLALVLDTHLEEVRKSLLNMEKNIDGLKKKSFIKRNPPTEKNDIVKKLSTINEGCVICDKINSTVDRYIDVFFHMWKTDADFKKKLENSKGLCIPHFNTLFKYSFKYLSAELSKEFIRVIYNKETEALNRIQNDIHRFTLKFDYRNSDMEWDGAQDAPLRTVEKLSGYVPPTEPLD